MTDARPLRDYLNSSCLQRSYAPGSADRKGLEAAVSKMLSSAPFEVPCIIDGEVVKTGDLQPQVMPHDHKRNLCTYHAATPEIVQRAIESSLKGKSVWEEMPWADRAAVFLKAADLIAGKYRFEIMAATMLGQGKNAWQAEIDAAAEVSDLSIKLPACAERGRTMSSLFQLCDFFRFSVKYVEELYAQQPPRNSAGTWK